MPDCQSLHKVGDFKDDAILDVIFIHGLTGDGYETWTHSGKEKDFWPGWLGQDFPSCNILTLDYKAAAMASFLTGPGLTVSEQAESLLDLLINFGIGERPIVFVTHSLGGIIAKDILFTAFNSVSPEKLNLKDATLGLVFLGTPHKGSIWANMAKIVPAPIASQLLEGLAYAGEHLGRLDKWFRHHWSASSDNVMVYCEGHKTKGVFIVNKVSSDPGVSGVEPTVLPLDHIQLAKPEDRNSQMYMGVSRLIAKLSKDIAKTRRVASGDEEPLDEFDPNSPLAQDYEYYTNPVSVEDRLTLEEKLRKGGRSAEIEYAVKAKQDFGMLFHKRTLQTKPVEFLGGMLADVSSRFRGHVYPKILEGGEYTAVSKAIHEDVIVPVHKEFKDNDFKPITSRTVEGALYYLGGHCHVKWHVTPPEEDENGES